MVNIRKVVSGFWSRIYAAVSISIKYGFGCRAALKVTVERPKGAKTPLEPGTAFAAE